MALIHKKDVAHLAQLARLKLSETEEEKLTGELEKILEHVSELNSVPTEGIEPLTGGTFLRGVYRTDESERTDDTGKGKGQFPDEEAGFLKVPSIF